MELSEITRRSIYTCWALWILVPLKAQNSFSRIVAPDSVTVVASEKFKNPTVLERFLIGENYSKVWSTAVKMPVFRLTHTDMKVVELGGGQQTKSLKLEDHQGREWSLRTVDKDAAGAIPKVMRGTLVQTIVQESISGSFPYGALVAGSLAKSVGVVAPDPELYYVPADAGLGKYQDIFTGKVCFLEEREPTRKKSEKTESTLEVKEDIFEANDRLVLQREVLKARLLDMLIADWDRHADQWRWGIVDSTKAKYYYAIPKDRDQAFFLAKGLIPRVGKFVGMHHINWFKDEAKGLQWLSYKSWNFDQLFLNDLDKAQWERTTKEFITRLADQEIANAVNRLPPEIYALSGKELEKKLISRRNSLLTNVMKYYKYISENVQVNGTNEDEIFQVSGADNGLNISVFREGAQGQKGTKIYERKFKKGETFHIYLMGYNGNDKFLIDTSVNTKIKVYMYGGEGRDEYIFNGKMRNEIRDFNGKEDIISKSSHTKVALEKGN
ncbi:hypothetical protein OCK74_07780 [Chitinophagaceae bacterium LB-8]|uniref:Uncharacterized protein n=1 Tax=Paraflavisolibacter caeni TaxID=2982496 RepID=A0A9X2XTZ2_9BACT|nr:hypothetical protein [Paraflavisolibacter caeni]MCU7549011.1 hypothetical protein [Paraflavisolibacter caeni]